MEISSPKQSVYYYEVSNKQFRLVLFIPPEELENLKQNGQISEEALWDYPDGVDLSCTEPDFEIFNEYYDYRPPHDPEALLRAFFSILSTTRNWKRFRGSGRIPAKDLEAALVSVEETLQDEKLVPEKAQPLSRDIDFKDRRRNIAQRDQHQRRMSRHLQQMEVKGIDPNRSLSQQVFSEVQMQEGVSAEEVFIRAHRKQKES